MPHLDASVCFSGKGSLRSTNGGNRASGQRGKKRGTFRSNTLRNAILLVSGSSSVVEHRLAKARVASSSLVSRSTELG